LVIIRGDWHLWIYCCGWRITQDGRVLATFESEKESIAAACGALDGQAVCEFTFQPDRGESVFKFDLGGALITAPYDKNPLEQWMLFCPGGYVLSYRSDGTFSHRREDTTNEEFSKVEMA
jgi:hypothetical protein